MNATCTLPFAFASLLLFVFWATWWFKLLIALIVAAVGFIYHLRKMNAAKHQKADLERQLLERKELLTYASQNEQKARKEAELAAANKRNLLSKISHEIRTPMNAVLGMAALLNDTPLNAEQQEYLSTIMNSGDNLLTIINDILMDDILEYSKIESGNELESKDFDLRNSVEEALDVFAAKSAKAGIDLVCNIDNDVPLQIVGDAFSLRQILMNFVENAFRFTTKGEICIGVHYKGTSADNRIKLEFEIRDSGSGMPAGMLEKISKDLAQSDASPANSYTIGLTLTICKRLVALMGGAIKVQSREKEGSIFSFTIYTTAALVPVRNNTVAEMASLEGKKILIADDNSAIRNMLSNQLSQWKLTSFTADSGNTALQLLSENSFDLVLTDLHMDDINGVDLARSIKKTHPSLPIILLGESGDETHKQHPNLFRSVACKPLRQHVLLKQILSVLSKNSNPLLSEEQNYKEKVSVQFAKKYPLNIIIAEDNKINQEFVLKFLNKLGYAAQIANDGQEVLEIVSNKRYDLILMDVQMPKMNGLEATRMIRLCLSEQPYIIALTANNLQGDREECLRAGMDDYLSKPINLQELVGLLEKCAQRVNQKN